MISLLENGSPGSAKAIVRSKRNLYIVGNRDLKGVIWIDDKLFFTTKNTASFNDIKDVMK